MLYLLLLICNQVAQVVGLTATTWAIECQIK